MNSDQLTNLMGNIKKKLKIEVKHIIDRLRSKGEPLGSAAEILINKGIVTGSTLSNMFLGDKTTESDFDIFLPYKESDFKHFTSLLTKYQVPYTQVNFNDEDYKTVSEAVESIKFEIGSMSKLTVNMIFVLNFEPMNLVSNFDFEVCNWFYEYQTHDLFVSEECLILLQKKELDFTWRRYELMKKTFDGTNLMMEEGTDAERLFHTTQNRLQKYIGLKKYVLSQRMRDTIEDINKRYRELWKV